MRLRHLAKWSRSDRRQRHQDSERATRVRATVPLNGFLYVAGLGVQVPTLLNKVWRPGPGIKSRLHDIAGRRATTRRIALNLPRAIGERILLDRFGRMPRQPWISYDAAAELARRMRGRPSTVLEFGSGASTIWFAERATRLHSVEHNAEWYKRVQTRLAAKAPLGAHVEHELREDEEGYTTFRKYHSGTFDIILIDGIWRYGCVVNHLDALRENGVLYIDNSDADSSTTDPGEIARTIAYLEDGAAETNRTSYIFTDFAPTALHATQGRLYA